MKNRWRNFCLFTMIYSGRVICAYRVGSILTVTEIVLDLIVRLVSGSMIDSRRAPMETYCISGSSR
jgi:hypothetical protein